MNGSTFTPARYFRKEKITGKGYLSRTISSDMILGFFWALEYGYEELKILFNRIARTVLHSFSNKSIAYDSGLNGGNFSSKYIIQDVITKKENMQELLEWSDENLDIYSLWLLPLKPEENSKLAPSYLDTELAINVGIWGRPQTEEDPRELKEKI